MRRRHPLVSGGRGDQHGISPFRAPRPSAASAVTAPLRSGRSALASLAPSAPIDAEAPPEGGGSRRPGSVVETQRDDAEWLAGSSRITSSLRRFRILFRCWAKGINVRTLIRGRSGSAGVNELAG